MPGSRGTAATMLGLAVLAVLAVLAGCAAPPGTAEPVRRAGFTVQSDPGVLIAVREVTAPAAARPGRPPVLLLHGARVPGVASFDLPVTGGSLAADVAAAGHTVFLMDARGYGGSTRPAALAAPAEANPPQARSDEVVRDVAAVVEEIANRTRAVNPTGRVALLGWATGGHWLGRYAAEHPDRVSHLVLYNTLYGPVDGHPTLGRGSQYEDPHRPGEFHTARFGAYRLSTAASLVPSWDEGIPTPDKTAWRDPVVLTAYQEAALASDPTSATRTPASFRAPSGAMQDSFYLATGRRLWHAGRITAATLILRGEYDFWSRPEDPHQLQRDLTAARSVRPVHLAGATHYVHLDRPERGRDQFLAEVTGFLATP